MESIIHGFGFLLETIYIIMEGGIDLAAIDFAFPPCGGVTGISTSSTLVAGVIDLAPT